MNKTVAVLGCGPAGLLAAHTLEREGLKPFIYSNAKQKSYITGAQFLHEPIEGLTNPQPDIKIEFTKSGTREGYANKVYGSPDAPCSWDEFPHGKVAAWSLRDVNDRLWERFSRFVSVAWITPGDIATLLRMYPMVISTIPAPAACHRPQHCSFSSATVWIRRNDAIGGGNQIIYNGRPEVPWYRASVIDGEGFMEYGHQVANSVQGSKPIGNTCQCFPDLVRAGRFGRWMKGVLVHEVQEVVRTAVRERELVTA